MERRNLIRMLASGGLGLASMPQEAPVAHGPQHSDCIAWIGALVTNMATVKSGMTRAQLLAVFRPDGALDRIPGRRFVCRECQFFKVDVEFRMVNKVTANADGRLNFKEVGEDVIQTISMPYVQQAFFD